MAGSSSRLAVHRCISHFNVCFKTYFASCPDFSRANHAGDDSLQQVRAAKFFCPALPPHAATSLCHLTLPPHFATSRCHLTLPPHAATSRCHLRRCCLCPYESTSPPQRKTAGVHPPAACPLRPLHLSAAAAPSTRAITPATLSCMSPAASRATPPPSSKPPPQLPPATLLPRYSPRRWLRRA